MDRSRVEEVGPDRVAAEWILRLGGSVKFKGFEHWNSNYNQLPAGPVYIEAINATGLAITSNGLEHLGNYHRTTVLAICPTCSCAGFALLRVMWANPYWVEPPTSGNIPSSPPP